MINAFRINQKIRKAFAEATKWKTDLSFDDHGAAALEKVIHNIELNVRTFLDKEDAEYVADEVLGMIDDIESLGLFYGELFVRCANASWKEVKQNGGEKKLAVVRGETIIFPLDEVFARIENGKHGELTARFEQICEEMGKEGPTPKKGISFDFILKKKIKITKPYGIASIRIELWGILPLCGREGALAFIDVLESRELWRPQRFKFDGRSEKFARDELLDTYAHCSGQEHRRYLNIARTSALQYDAFLNFAHPASLSISFSPDSTFAEDVPQIFELASELAEAIRPVIGWVCLIMDDSQMNLPEAERNTQSMIHKASFVSNEHRAGGLGHRTFLNRKLSEALGVAQQNSAIPYVVHYSSHGGTVIDLLASPWNQSGAELRESWQTSMNTLSDPAIFGDLVPLSNGTANLVPKTGSDLRQFLEH